MADYSIWLLEYGHVVDHTVGGLLYGHYNEGTLLVPFGYYALRGEGRTIMVDTGYVHAGSGQAYGDIAGVSGWRDPHEILGRVGIAPEDVDTVLLTHAHFDHAGNLRAFPNAHFVLQRRELEGAVSALALPARLQWLRTALNPDDVHAMLDLACEGRLTLVEGTVDEVLPGIDLHPAFETHTPGSQYVVVETESNGRFVLAGDVVYTAANVEGVDGDGTYLPLGFAVGSQETTLHAMDSMAQLVGFDTLRIIPVHDAKLWDRYPTVTHRDGLHVTEICRAPDIIEADVDPLAAVSSQAVARAAM